MASSSTNSLHRRRRSLIMTAFTSLGSFLAPVNILISSLLLLPASVVEATSGSGLTAVAPRASCSAAVQCNGNGVCGPLGGGDLCICNPFWEGMYCETRIRDIKIEYEGGISGGGLAGIVVGSILIIPATTGVLLFMMARSDCLDD
ncbi:unnamed protein product [Amoebophrya sp. A25]|nr:unnamed protein product [Amoebophrya sp. A25]|eukprot:GSA25T00003104001.1